MARDVTPPPPPVLPSFAEAEREGRAKNHFVLTRLVEVTRRIDSLLKRRAHDRYLPPSNAEICYVANMGDVWLPNGSIFGV